MQTTTSRCIFVYNNVLPMQKKCVDPKSGKDSQKK